MLIRNHRGAALLEFCLVVPIMLVMVFAIIDFGRLINARLIVTNLTREGGNLASRDIKSGNDLIAMLQASARPLNLNQLGRIYITRIEAGTGVPASNVYPQISSPRYSAGALNVASGIQAGGTLGLTSAIYNHMVFKPANQTADINGVTVVETFYEYRPITPLPRFIANILLNNGTGMIIGSRAVFCSSGG
jgi:hypothetical protein